MNDFYIRISFIRKRVSHQWVQALIILLFFSMFSSAPKAETEPGSVPLDGDSQIANLPDFPPLQEFDEVMQRPLFNADRKPRLKPSGPTGGNEQALRETWKLTGVMITGERVMALFEERKGSKRLRLEVGMPLDDHWELEEVNVDGVSVISGDQLVRLELRQPREIPPVSANEQKAPVNGAQGKDSTTSGRKANPTQGTVPQRGKVQEL